MGKKIIPLYKQIDVTIEEFNPASMRQQVICKQCQWCCHYDVFEIHNDTALEVYYARGRSIIWEPKVRKWFVLEYVPCPHIKEDGCSIYSTRPWGCVEWMCPYPDGTIHQKMDIYITASERILKQKFGNKYEKVQE